MVVADSAASSTSAMAQDAGLTAGARTNRRISAAAATTSSTTTPTSGRYIRRSAPTSAEIGTTLDEGARVMKIDAAQKPTRGTARSAAAAAAKSTATASTPGHASCSVIAPGTP